ncbi:MAG: DNA primase [Bacillota bacterium]|nr:DNA primase [Bacillota bacterium]
MPQGIPEEIIDEIRQHTDLVNLTGEYLKLERRGKNMVGLCPFHNEKTPSFTVSPEKQLFHCFGCGASGNVFSLVMQLENLSFPEAARFLADRAGVKIPEYRKEKAGEEDLKENIYKLNQLAARFFAYCLTKTKSGSKALGYLQKRGINAQSAETFKLGYAPADWTGFFNFAHKKGIPADLMVKAGLVSPGKDKGYYDRFRDRLIFPIFNISGKVAGFGGRSLNENENSGPKYLNSPETPVFNKGSMLYGLNLSREAIRREKKAVVMEGYTDVITAYQEGIENVVASLGTALTAEQGRILRHQAETVITAYDSDTAGEAATWRGLSILQKTGCLVHVAELPEGSDPDSYIKEYGKEAFLTLVDKATPLMEYRLLQLKKQFDLTSDRGRLDYTEELMSFLLAAVNQVEQDFYLKRAAEELAIDEDALRRELKIRRKKTGRAADSEQTDFLAAGPAITVRRAEKILISLMLQSKDIAEKGRNNLEPEYFEDKRIREVIESIWALAEEDLSLSTEKLLNRFEDSQVVKMVTEAVTDPELQDLQPKIAKRMAEDCMNEIRQSWLKSQKRDIQKKLKELETSGTEEEIKEFMNKYQHLLLSKDGSPDRPGKGGDFDG